MIKENQRWFNLVSNVIDIFCLTFSYVASVWYWLYFSGHEVGNVSASQTSLLFYVAIYLFSLKACGAFDSARLKELARDLLSVIQATGITCGIFVALLFLTKQEMFSRGVFVLSFTIAPCLLMCKRIVVKLIMRAYRNSGYNLKNVVLVGNGKLAQGYLRDVKKNPFYGFSVMGYLNRTENPLMCNRLGTFEDIDEVLEKYKPDQVVIALEAHEVEYISTLICACEKQNVKALVVPFYNEYIQANPVIEVIGDTKLLNVRTTPLDVFFNRVAKRVVDIVFSVFIILLTSPIMICTAIIIKCTSNGSVIFKQERVGKNKKPFMMYKFRSMSPNASEQSAWSTDSDSRKTKFGSFIRKFSIDELPQFFNVLKGDMSVIGPRPEIPFYVDQFKETIPLYMLKHEVHPGITGWAQVKGYRGDTSIEGRVRCDLWYIEHWSFWLDLKIVWMTLAGGLMNKEKIDL